MATETVSTPLMEALQEAANRAVRGGCDPQSMQKAREEMDRIREEIREEHGTLNIGVPAIRELRGELPKP
jgi:hypothetical protein